MKTIEDWLEKRGELEKQIRKTRYHEGKEILNQLNKQNVVIQNIAITCRRTKRWNSFHDAMRAFTRQVEEFEEQLLLVILQGSIR